MTILILLAVCWIVLRSQRTLSLKQLRIFEIAVFGAVFLQEALMMHSLLGQFAIEADATSLIGAKYRFLGAWSILIFVYGVLMPNTWRRCVAMMLPVALVPYLILALQRWLAPPVATILAAETLGSPVPLPVVAAAVAAYGTHIINSARREAFKARQFGQYRLLEKLGSGGMGEVYKAEHVLLKRPCAMKLIKPGSDTDLAAIARFEIEVKATSKLTHWNTVEIYDYGHTEDGTFYYVMELLPGLSLEELVEQYGSLSPGRVVHLLGQVCGALQEAHNVGLIHRDIKPANIFAAQRGGVFDVAKLLDFGLVKERSGSSDPDSENGLGSFSGTPLFMSPEQASAYDQVDGRADIYALGAVAYYLLTGQPLFPQKNVVQLLAAHANEEVAPPSTINADVPSDLEQILLRCLQKKAEARFPDAESLRKALAGCECSAEWTSETASAWWHDRQLSSQRTSRSEQRPIEMTVDFQPDDTEVT
jgi:serine/threonine-protein kinase